MMRALIAVVALAGTSLALDAGESLCAVGEESRAGSALTARARAVTDYLAVLESASAPRLRPLALYGSPAVAAPAQGGVFGWFVGQVNVWLPTLDGNIQTSGGDSVDLEDDLGVSDEELTIFPLVQVSLGGLGLRLSGFRVEFAGDSLINRTFSFGGLSFSVSERVRSDLEITNISLHTFYPLVSTGVFRLAVQGGISYFRLDGTLTGDSSGSAQEEIDLPIPVLGVLFQGKFGGVLVEVDVTAFTINFADIEGTLFDAQVSVGYTVFKVVAVRAGYRIILIEGNADDFDVDMTLSGFFVGVSAQF